MKGVLSARIPANKVVACLQGALPCRPYTVGEGGEGTGFVGSINATTHFL